MLHQFSYNNGNDGEFDDDDDDTEEEEEECALVVFSGRFPQLPLTEQNISPANHHHHHHCHDDHDDDYEGSILKQSES